MTSEPTFIVAQSRTSSIAAAVRRGSFLYTSGVLAIDDAGRVLAPGDLRAQADHIYRRLGEILTGAGASCSDVVKVNCYVSPDVDSAAARAFLSDAHKAYIAPGRSAALAAPLPQPVDGCMLQVELIARPGAPRQSIVVADIPVASDWAAAVRAGSTLYVGGRLPVIAPLRLDDAPHRVDGDLGAQTAVVYGHHDRVLRAAGIRWSDAVQVHQFLTPRRLSIDEFQRARHRYLTPGRYLSTSVACEANFPDFPVENVLILADMEADTQPRTNVAALEAWGNKPGPQAFRSGPVLRMHGQVARNLDARTQHEDDIAGQADLVFRNLDAILRTAGVQWSDVAHARIFCKRRDDIAAVRQVRENYIASRSCAVTELLADYFDPLLLLEIELVAIQSES